MTIIQAFLLGIVQGLTEFIPVSSSAHLLIAQKILGIPADDAMFSFLVIVQLGTIISLVVFYWKDLLLIARSTLDFKRSTPERDLGFYIIIATIPALLAGYLLKDAVEALFQQPMLEAAIRLFSAAILLSLVEWLGRRVRKLDSMTWQDALVIGLFQVIAVFPGASRSGATIAGGMSRGFDRPSAARFAFLMSMPVMLAAGGYQMLDVLQMPDLGAFLPVLAMGFVTAAFIGWLAIRWLIGYLGRKSLFVFAIYCALLGAIVLAASFLLG
jgi:undecaprenyl-diphosphatase